ncbi:MAG TPA: PDZ domain-containing protein, partial [Lacipirellulaceae bacterium]|nr:PDZ domain-containing protein [Lacipirellulaceae bacterium]
MTTHRFNSTCRVSILSIVALSLAIFALPAGAQNVRVAQREDAGESASDDPADADELTVYPDAQDEEGEVLSPEEQAAALDQRGGEQVVDDPNNLAMILGMHVQEADSGRVKVVDVAAGSPAFESGVREGDEIASFDGFKAESYREWIDGIRRLVTDTPDGSAVSVELVRGDERITAEIRTPEAKADDVRRLGPLGQQITGQQVQGQGTVPPTGANQPFAPGVISDNDVFVNDSGFFDDDLAGTTDRAVAEIFRITPQQTAPEQTAPQQTAPLNPPNQPSGQAATAAAATGQRTPPNAARARQNSLRPNNPGVGGASRIGMAGFRDDTNGMIVMLDVGGLAPGTYPVGIEDAGLILGGQQPMRSARNTQAPERDVRSQERMNRVRRPFDRQRTNSLQLDNPPANAPRPRPQLRQAPRRGSGNQDQSQTQSTPSIPRNVLAQVTNENSGSGTATPPTGQVQPNLTPPTGEVNPNLTPPTGEVNPNLTAPTGEANPNLTPPTGQVLPPGAPPTGRVLPSGTSPTGQPDPDAVGDEGLVGLDDSDIASVNPL